MATTEDLRGTVMTLNSKVEETDAYLARYQRHQHLSSTLNIDFEGLVVKMY